MFCIFQIFQSDHVCIASSLMTNNNKKDNKKYASTQNRSSLTLRFLPAKHLKINAFYELKDLLCHLAKKDKHVDPLHRMMVDAETAVSAPALHVWLNSFQEMMVYIYFLREVMMTK